MPRADSTPSFRRYSNGLEASSMSLGESPDHASSRGEACRSVQSSQRASFGSGATNGVLRPNLSSTTHPRRLCQRSWARRHSGHDCHHVDDDQELSFGFGIAHPVFGRHRSAGHVGRAWVPPCRRRRPFFPSVLGSACATRGSLASYSLLEHIENKKNRAETIGFSKSQNKRPAISPCYGFF